MERPENKKAFVAYTLVLALLLGTIAILDMPFGELSERQWIGLGVFTLIAVLAQGYLLQVPFGRAFLGLSGTLFWALIVAFPPIYAAAAAFVSLLLSELAFQGRKPTKAIFNAVQTGLSTYTGAFLLHDVFGYSALEGHFLFFGSFAVAAFAYWMVNTGLVSAGARILYAESASRFWLSNFKWAFFYELTSAPIAIAVVFAYQELWIVGLFLITLPIMMLRLAYTQYLELKKTYHETVRTLVKIIEMHDPYTAGHSDRVAVYAQRLCEAIRLSPAQTEKILLAAYLHDLGKINLDLHNIVRKAGPLTDDEKRLIKLHSVVSADLANQVSYFKGEIESMIRHHHENWDGSGYPHGLKADEIPLGSRIILLADAFDAMTTSRVYRSALDLDHVKAEFRKFAGSQFDPALVEPFLERVVGDGTTMISQPRDPMEGTRARDSVQDAKVEPIRRVVIG